MAYNNSTAERIRTVVSADKRFTEKKMFGGVGFLLYGNMCVGVWKEYLILRVGAERWDELLCREFVREFDITGRSMRGWVMIEPDGFDSEQQLSDWIALAVAFTSSLPAK